MNREPFEKLPDAKKKIIEQAYYAAFNKEIQHNDFFLICKKTLTDIEYASIFVNVQEPRQGEQTMQRDNMHTVNNMNNQINQSQSYQNVSKIERGLNEEIKTENIEDIMQYSGIDLKEEAENIVKEAEHSVTIANYEDSDYNDHIESLFNGVSFREFILNLCIVRRINITEEAVQMLFRVIRRKLLDFIEKMNEASRIRVEAGLASFNFEISNEVSKQLWYLNELEKINMKKLMIKKDEDVKKKKMIQEREDLMIKKRQSNSVAMAAMGLKHKSWMNPDASNYMKEQSRFSSIYSPFDEKSFDKNIKNRTITIKDYLYVLERDKRYNKSIFLIQHYFK